MPSSSRCGLGAAGGQRRLVPRHQTPGELGLGLADGASHLVVELDGDVGDPAGRDVLGDVDLAATDDALVDDAGARGRVEARVGRRQPGLLELVHELAERLLVVDPAEVLPDRPEVLDVVDQGRAGQREQQRPARAGADALGELEHVLRALRGLVLDEVGLVDDHRAEAEVAQPADVAVEHLVVDDHDVGEAVDVLAVAVDDRGHAVRHPHAGLAGPVHLHHVGHHRQQREGVGRLGGEQGLGGLAETGLVGEQEGAVTVGRRRDDLGLVLHQLQHARQHHLARVGQGHGRGGAVADLLEGPEQRTEQLPAGQAPGLAAALRGGAEVGHQERVGQLAGQHRLRDHPTFGDGGELVGLLGLLLRELDAGALEHRPAQVGGLVGDLGVLGQQGEQRRLAGGGLGQDGGDAVEPLQLAVSLGLGEGGVAPDAGALLAGEQGHGLEPRAHRHALAALHGGLDLAHGARQDRDQALVVEGPGAPLAA